MTLGYYFGLTGPVDTGQRLNHWRNCGGHLAIGGLGIDLRFRRCLSGSCRLWKGRVPARFWERVHRGGSGEALVPARGTCDRWNCGDGKSAVLYGKAKDHDGDDPGHSGQAIATTRRATEGFILARRLW